MLQSGYCGVTKLGGDCSAGRSGAWRLCPVADDFQLDQKSVPRRSLSSALTACLARCRNCPRCRYVSFSVKHADCSWFASCPHVRRDVGGFYTLEVAALNRSALATAVAAAVGHHSLVTSIRQGEQPAAGSARKLRVLVSFYGALSRGVLLAGPNLQKHLVAPLQSASFVRSVHVLCTSLDVLLMDGVRACGHARELLGCDEFLSQPEAEVLHAVASRCNSSSVTCKFSHWFYKRDCVVRRAGVQLHEENRVARYLKEHGHRYMSK